MESLAQEIRDALASPDQLRTWLTQLPNDSSPVGFAKAPCGCPIAYFLNITVIKDKLGDDDILYVTDNNISLYIGLEERMHILIRSWLWAFRFLIDEEPEQYPISRDRALQLLADAEQDPAAT